MTTYHKIDAPFMRDGKGKMLHGQWCRPEFEYLADNEWEFTEKVDGTNIRMYFSKRANGYLDPTDMNIQGRTDNAQIPKALLSELQRLMLEVSPAVGAVMTVRGIDELVVYGEGYGAKINGGGNYSDMPKFVAFDVKVGDYFLLRKDVDSFCDNVGFESVPVLGYGTLQDAMDLVKSGLRSRWGMFEAEGVVAVPTVPLFNRLGNRVITKIKARDFRS